MSKILSNWLLQTVSDWLLKTLSNWFLHTVLKWLLETFSFWLTASDCIYMVIIKWFWLVVTYCLEMVVRDSFWLVVTDYFWLVVLLTDLCDRRWPSAIHQSDHGLAEQILKGWCYMRETRWIYVKSLTFEIKLSGS